MLPPGALITAPVRLAEPASFGNPGALDYGRFLEARGLAATGRVPSARLVRVDAPAGWIEAAADHVRRGWSRGMERAFALAGAFGEAGTARAVTIGEREAISRQRSRALRLAGTAHLLAISGFHVAIVSAVVAGILLASGAPRMARLALLAAALLGYMSLTSGMASVRRAVTAAVILISARLLGRGADAATLIGAAFLAAVAPHPAGIGDAALQLSFVAAGGLVVAAGPIRDAIPGPRWLRSAIAANGSALVAVTPLAAMLFNRVTPGAILANLGAAPAMACGLAASLLAPPAAAVAGWLAAARIDLDPDLAPSTLLARIAGGAFRFAEALSAAIGGIPGAGWIVTTPSGRIVFSATALIAIAGAGSLPRPLRRAALFGATLCTVWISLPMESAAARARGMLSVTFFDVGQGSSTLVETPEGRRILVDGGGFPRSSLDVGELVVARALLSMGIRSIDAVAISHDDFDHAGGIPSILRIFAGAELWIGGGGAHPPVTRESVDIALSRGRTLLLLAAGSRFEFGGATFLALNPASEPGDGSDNERSLVLRVEAGRASLLLTGDIGSATEERLQPGPPVEVLQVPHHGSRGSTSPWLVRATRPRWAVVSCGRRNRYGHPAGPVLSRLAGAGAQVLRTDTSGAIRVVADPRTGSSTARRWDGGAWRPAGAAPAASADDPDRARHEAGDEDDASKDRDEAPGPRQDGAFLHEPRVAGAEEDDERRPEEPGLVDRQPEDDEAGEAEPREVPVKSHGEGVGNMAPVELPHREEVQRGRQEAHPSGEDHA
jgi:competence protein ComEC